LRKSIDTVLRRIYAEFTHDTQDLRNIYAKFTHDTQHLRTGVEQGIWNLTVVLFTHDTQDIGMINLFMHDTHIYA
jgi:hypothetical protein